VCVQYVIDVRSNDKIRRNESDIRIMFSRIILSTDTPIPSCLSQVAIAATTALVRTFVSQRAFTGRSTHRSVSYNTMCWSIFLKMNFSNGIGNYPNGILKSVTIRRIISYGRAYRKIEREIRHDGIITYLRDYSCPITVPFVPPDVTDYYGSPRTCWIQARPRPLSIKSVFD